MFIFLAKREKIKFNTIFEIWILKIYVFYLKLMNEKFDRVSNTVRSLSFW